MTMFATKTNRMRSTPQSLYGTAFKRALMGVLGVLSVCWYLHAARATHAAYSNSFTFSVTALPYTERKRIPALRTMARTLRSSNVVAY